MHAATNAPELNLVNTNYCYVEKAKKQIIISMQHAHSSTQKTQSFKLGKKNWNLTAEKNTCWDLQPWQQSLEQKYLAEPNLPSPHRPHSFRRASQLRPIETQPHSSVTLESPGSQLFSPAASAETSPLPAPTSLKVPYTNIEQIKLLSNQKWILCAENSMGRSRHTCSLLRHPTDPYLTCRLLLLLLRWFAFWNSSSAAAAVLGTATLKNWNVSLLISNVDAESWKSILGLQ